MANTNGEDRPQDDVITDRSIYLVIRRAILSVIHIFDRKFKVTSLDK